MQTKRIALAVFAFMLMAFFNGCDKASDYPAELPMPSFEAPSVIGEQRRVIEAELYFCAQDGRTLEIQTRTIRIDIDESVANAVVKELELGPSEGSRMIGVVPKTLSFDKVELTGDVCNVYFTGEITENALLALRASLAATLNRAQGTPYIDVFINGEQPGYKTRPLGPLSPIDLTLEAYMMNTLQEYSSSSDENNDAPLYETRNASFYYADSAGELLLCDVKSVVYSKSADGKQIATALITELLKGPLSSQGREVLFPLDMSLRRVEIIDPTKQTLTNETDEPADAQTNVQTNAGNQIVELYFSRPSKLENPRLAYASVLCTVADYIPNIAGVRIYVGDEMIRAIGEQRSLSGIFTRSQASDLLGQLVRLYFPDKNGQGLYAVKRGVKQEQIYNPHSRLNELFTGLAEPGVKLEPFVPEDILSVSRVGKMIIINFAPGFYDKLSSYLRTPGASTLPDHTRARMFVFSLVNTMCDLPDTSGVWMLEDGELIEQTLDMIYLGGPIYENPGLIIP